MANTTQETHDWRAVHELIEASLASIEQKQRARAILAGRDPDEPRKTLAQIREDTERLRAANEEALKHLRAANRSQPKARRRTTHLKVV